MEPPISLKKCWGGYRRATPEHSRSFLGLAVAPNNNNTEEQASQALPTESGGARKGATDPTSGFVDGEPIRSSVEKA